MNAKTLTPIIPLTLAAGAMAAATRHANAPRTDRRISRGRARRLAARYRGRLIVIAPRICPGA